MKAKIVQMWLTCELHVILGQLYSINLFINSNAILNCDALWSIQGKNLHVNAAIVKGIRSTGKVLR